jgi:hypothetical protein
MSTPVGIQTMSRIMLWLLLADFPIIVIPVLLYLRLHDIRFAYIPLPLGLLVNSAILYSQRKTLLRKSSNG